MTFIRFKTRLLIAFWVVLFLALCLPATYFYQSLRSSVLSQTRKNAIHHLDFVKWLTLKYAPFNDEKELDTWCRQVGKQLGYRITIIKADGTVIADSAVAFSDLPTLENHAQREEIAAARKGETVMSMRVSSTIHRPLIYTATRMSPANTKYPLYLRVAIPHSIIESRLADYSRHFGSVLALILLFTLGISYYLAAKLESPVRQIIERIQAVGAGDYSHHFIMDSGREFYQISTSINAMTDRISAQVDQISRQKEDLSAILENLREGVMLISPDGGIKMINAALSGIAGNPGKAIGKPPVEVFMVPGVQEVCDNILTGAAATSASVVFPRKRMYEIYAVRTGEGGAVMVFYDISKKKRVEKIRQDFVANVSHELKTPLTSIKGYAETLVSGNFVAGETGKNFLRIIEKNANRMIAMVDDLLALTRLEQHPVDKDILPVDAGACLTCAIETCMLLMENKKIKIENRVPAGLTVMADKNALERVFLNLTDNAVRYSPENGTIIFSASVVNKTVIFSVRDQGPGIPAADRERIFERFYRVDKERSRKSGGTGLGLSICRNAVSQMGGSIWVKSPPEGADSGSEFFFTLNTAA